MSGFFTKVTGGGLGGLGILGCGFPRPAPATPAPLPNPLADVPPPFLVPFVCAECTDDGVAAPIGRVPREDADSGDEERSRSRNSVEDSRRREGILDCEWVMDRK